MSKYNHKVDILQMLQENVQEGKNHTNKWNGKENQAVCKWKLIWDFYVDLR